MANIVLELEDSLLQKLISISSNEKMTFNEWASKTLSAQLGELQEKPTQSLLDLLIKRVKEKKVEEEFSLLDIVTKDEWRSLSPGKKRGLGRKFKNKLDKEKIKTSTRKTSANLTMYTKKDSIN